jgi:ABC-type thiamine transport system ATPase subunit
MKTQLLRQLIREEIKNQITPDEKNQITPSIKTISKDLDDQKSNFSTINTKEKFILFMDEIFSKLDPKFKDSPIFKQAIYVLYNKYK